METKRFRNRRGGYEKLEGSSCRKRKTVGTAAPEEAAQLPSSPPKQRSSWITKLIAPLKLDKLVKACDAKKICVGLRDAYVDFMIRNANTGVIAEGLGAGYVVYEEPFGVGSWKHVKEYDDEMIVERYKSGDLVLVQRPIAPVVSS